MKNIKHCIEICELNIYCIDVPTKLSVYFVADYYVQKNPTLTLTMSLKSTIQSGSHICLKQGNYVFPPLRYAWYTTHIYYLPSYDYVNNNWWTETDMKLTTETFASLYSYLPLTSNILNTLLSQTLNLCSSGDIMHQISYPHKMTGKMAVLYICTCKILNWMAARIAWTYPALFSKNMALLYFHQDLTYLKGDSQQSDSDTSKAMWHKIQTAPDITISSVQNPFSTFQLLH